MASSYETYGLGNFQLQNGQEITDANIAYKTFGDAKSPAVVYPSWYSGLISDNEWLIGQDKTLNPAKYFIVITALFGNGQSSSPSDRPDLRPFPQVSFYDNVKAQHRLVTEKLGVRRARGVLGWSMGAGQTYQWATQFPDFMDLIIPFCGSAKTSLHNQVMLEGVKSAVLSGESAWSGGVCRGEDLQGQYRTWSDKKKKVGLKAVGRVQSFYREKLYETAPTLGFMMKGLLKPLEACRALTVADPENSLTMLHTWQTADCSAREPYDGDFDAAMNGIKAKALVLPSNTDLYFRTFGNAPG